jgi:hypothetical protein
MKTIQLVWENPSDDKPSEIMVPHNIKAEQYILAKLEVQYKDKLVPQD